MGSRDPLRRLLAGRDELTAVEKDAILERVLARGSRRSRRLVAGGALVGVTAAAALALLLVVRAQPGAPKGGDLTARGEAAPTLRLRCAAAPEAARCPRASRLFVEL